MSREIGNEVGCLRMAYFNRPWNPRLRRATIQSAHSATLMGYILGALGAGAARNYQLTIYLPIVTCR